jgi:hypothetical protein
MGFNVHYEINGISQPTGDSCWLASLTMIINWKYSSNYGPEEVAQHGQASIQMCVGWDMLYNVAQVWGITPGNHTPAEPEDWAHELESHGPLWLVVPGNTSHAIVMNGIAGDGTPDGTNVELTDPWSGPRTITWHEFAEFFGQVSGKLQGEAQIMYF